MLAIAIRIQTPMAVHPTAIRILAGTTATVTATARTHRREAAATTVQTLRSVVATAAAVDVAVVAQAVAVDTPAVAEATNS